MTKKVYYQVPGWVHTFDKELIHNPPQGYEFILGQTAWDRGIRRAVNSYSPLYILSRKVLGELLPIYLVKACLDSFLVRIPEEVDLIYARDQLVFRKRPWVIHIEWLTILAGYWLRDLKRHKVRIERLLASKYCKKILTWSELARESILLNLDRNQFESKVEVIPLAVPKKYFVKSCRSDRVRLLFVGTANSRGSFEVKGGKEVLEAFSLLNKKYDNLELVIRSDVPPHLRSRCLNHPNIRLIEDIIPWEQLEEEFKSSDIFLFPCHHTTPFDVILDAMSYESPTIVTDVYANSELVENGKTGFVIRKAENAPYLDDNLLPPCGLETSPINKTIKTVDPKVVADLVEKASILIENPELRRRMGAAARREVEHGKFSIKRRNEKLKRIFDEAISGEKA